MAVKDLVNNKPTSVFKTCFTLFCHWYWDDSNQKDHQNGPRIDHEKDHQKDHQNGPQTFHWFITVLELPFIYIAD